MSKKSIFPSLLSFRWLVAGAVACAVAGCNKEADPESSSSAPGASVTVMTGPPPPPAPGKPDTNPVPAQVLTSGMSKDDATGVPTTDGEKNLDAQQGLQRAVDYYNRSMRPASGPQAPGQQRQMLPALTSLEQLVQYRVIKAVPPAPAGKKWVLEGDRVKLQ